MTEKKRSADIREYVARHGLSNGNEDEYAAGGWADCAAALEAEFKELLRQMANVYAQRDILAAENERLRADLEGTQESIAKAVHVLRGNGVWGGFGDAEGALDLAIDILAPECEGT